MIHSVSYGQDGARPGEADGKGFTLQQRELSSDPALPASWRLSTFENGTPGSVPSPNALTAEAWRVLNFSAAELTQSQISDLSSDPDRDGFSNLLEFAFAKQPLTAEANPPFQIEIEMIGGAPYLTLTFERPANSTLQYVLQKSTDLSDWRTRPLIRVRSSLNPATQIETLTVREKQPMEPTSPNGGTQMRIRIAE